MRQSICLVVVSADCPAGSGRLYAASAAALESADAVGVTQVIVGHSGTPYASAPAMDALGSRISSSLSLVNGALTSCLQNAVMMPRCGTLGVRGSSSVDTVN